jgi:hypothetical protein
MRTGWGIAWTAAVLSACAGRTVDSTDGGGAGGNAGEAAAAASGGSGGPFFAESGGASSHPPSNHCEREGAGASYVPTNFYFVLDASASMLTPDDGGRSRWAIATEGLGSFARAVRTLDQMHGIGLSMFPASEAACSTPTFPDLEIGPASVSATPFVDVLGARKPAGLRNTGAALRSAIAHLRTGIDPVPLYQLLAVLVVGGPSDACDSTSVSELVALVRDAARGEPMVRTAVVVIGEPMPELDAVAKAGLTGSAFTLRATEHTTENMDDMLESMTAWAGCTFRVPTSADPAAPLNPGLLSVAFTPFLTQVTEDIVKLRTSADCPVNAGEGWYFDNPVYPTRILLCPDTCERTPLGDAVIWACPPVPQ